MRVPSCKNMQALYHMRVKKQQRDCIFLKTCGKTASGGQSVV